MRIRSLVVLLLLVGACAQPAVTDAEPGSTTTTQASSVPQTEPSTTGDPSASTSTVAPMTTRPAPNPDREPAPDFSLTLADGTEYRYAEEVRPVYLVFWAEW